MRSVSRLAVPLPMANQLDPVAADQIEDARLSAAQIHCAAGTG